MKLKQTEFKWFQKLILDEIGIYLDNTKTSLLQNRLYDRLIHFKIENFSEYLKIVKKDKLEKREMLNLITINETYFFRESQHFDFLISVVKDIEVSNEFKIWSAASSVGAEAYTIAMILNEFLNSNQWKIVGTDINTNVIKEAKKGLYKESLMSHIPDEYKTKYCLKGKGKYEGKFTIDMKLKHNVSFDINNLIIPNHSFGLFDIIFLRNVFIYFNTQTKQRVLDDMINHLKVGGYLIISLTENFDGLNIGSLEKHQSSIYKKRDIK